MSTHFILLDWEGRGQLFMKESEGSFLIKSKFSYPCLKHPTTKDLSAAASHQLTGFSGNRGRLIRNALWGGFIYNFPMSLFMKIF